MNTYYRIASLGFVACLSAATPALATLISVVGNGIIVPPPAQVQNAAVTNAEQWGFNERQNVLLAAPLSVDSGSLAAGSLVSSHMIFLNSAGTSTINTTAAWTFSGIILGVMSDNGGALEVASSPILGAPGTSYPAAGFANRGLETPDSYLGVGTNTLVVNMNVTQPGDWIRVVTQSTGVPDGGSSALLLGLGLSVIVFGFRRKRVV